MIGSKISVWHHTLKRYKPRLSTVLLVLALILLSFVNTQKPAPGNFQQPVIVAPSPSTTDTSPSSAVTTTPAPAATTSTAPTQAATVTPETSVTPTVENPKPTTTPGTTTTTTPDNPIKDWLGKLIPSQVTPSPSR